MEYKQWELLSSPTSLLEMCCLPTDLSMENSTKSIGKHFTDRITDGQDSSVTYVSVIKEINITNGKYPYV